MNSGEINLCAFVTSNIPLTCAIRPIMSNDTPKKPVLKAVAKAPRPSKEEAMAAVRTLIAWAGDNPDREGLIDTPKRVVYVAYLPTDKVVGISKLVKVVEIFARRLQTQETMTAQIASAIDDALKPRGSAVMIDAAHQCMTTRGVHHPNVSTITTQFTGEFKTNPALQERFLRLIKPG